MPLCPCLLDPLAQGRSAEAKPHLPFPKDNPALTKHDGREQFDVPKFARSTPEHHAPRPLSCAHALCEQATGSDDYSFDGGCMNRYRFFAWPAYLVGISLILIPLIDVVAQTWPLNVGNEQWRFGAIGLLSNAFIAPAAGILIVLGTAIALEHNFVMRLSGWLCASVAALATLTLSLFILDAIQTRVNVRPEALFSFTVATGTAVGKMILAILTLVAFALAGVRTARAAAAPRSIAGVPLAPAATRVARRA